MAWRTNVLVVANVTASSDDLLKALQRLADQEPARFTLVVPASPFGGGREAAANALDTALTRFREAGLEADGELGDGDPCVAVSEIWDPKRFDRIVVCTLPLGSSKWLHAGLPERIGRLTGAPVTHVVSHPAPPAVTTEPAPQHHESLGPFLAPYSVLGHTEDREHEHERRQRL
jgi:GABA permease